MRPKINTKVLNDSKFLQYFDELSEFSGEDQGSADADDSTFEVESEFDDGM